ncbi:hypothetical protein O7542_25130 [Micromonospora sp. WMMC264]|uniref:hypothetical protein n=1 Tax=Micromonospora TaxID=1873 RepID=UPI00248B3646|nr:hypothetical protein [Micromonospora sp. WMMC264]WBB84583.1 hypothetical protein O7542_25130 [Micromonospora sp. WMMC264]
MGLPVPGGNGDGHQGGGPERWIWSIAGSGLLTVLLLTMLAGSGVGVGATATEGVRVVGAIIGAAFSVLALLIRRRGR